MGYWEYEPIADRCHIPIVVTGFEPVDLLHGIYMCIRQLEDGRAEVENQYSRSVRRAGNEVAQRTLQQVFAVQRQGWRGMGEIEASGLGLAPAYARFDALARFPGIAIAAGRSGRMHQWRDPAWTETAGGLPGFRHALHPGDRPRRHDGLF